MDTFDLTVEAVVACSQYDYAIGKGNTLPWSLPGDLQRFKQITAGHVVIMGRKTAESIGRALPKRTNIVLSQSTIHPPYPEQLSASSMSDALYLAKALIDSQPPGETPRKVFVIGGEGIYKAAMPYLTGLHLTKVDVMVEGADAFWPMDHFNAFIPPWQLIEDDRGWVEVIDNGVATHYMHYQIDRSRQGDRWVGIGEGEVT